jgi:hypothetical protein
MSVYSLWKGREYRRGKKKNRRGNVQHLTAKSVLKNCFTVFSEIKENKLVVLQKAYVEKPRLLDAVFRGASTVPIWQGI